MDPQQVLESYWGDNYPHVVPVPLVVLIMEYADLAPLLSDARTELARRRLKLNPDHWQTCLTDDLVDLVQAGKNEEASEVLMSCLLRAEVCGCNLGVCSMWDELAPPDERPPGSTD